MSLAETMGEASTLPPVVVMGVAGCGKSAVGAALARALGADFIEGDSFHPPENVALMAAGTPLTDENRAGWLDTVAGEIAARKARGAPVVATCSALKRKYRDRLRAQNPSLVLVHLTLDRETAFRRVGMRKGHFMPTSLVESQFADLEPPSGDEAALALDATRLIENLVSEASSYIRSRER